MTVYFAKPPNNNVVRYIDRNSSYRRTKGPNLASLLASLEEKYNKASHSQSDRDYTWSTSENTSPPCLTWSNLPPNLDFKELISNECGLTLNVQVSQRNKLVNRVYSRVYDSDMLKNQRDNTKKWIESYVE
mgnify:CR=1 FL=1